jgi:hypothetical protein
MVQLNAATLRIPVVVCQRETYTGLPMLVSAPCSRFPPDLFLAVSLQDRSQHASELHELSLGADRSGSPQ